MKKCILYKRTYFDFFSVSFIINSSFYRKETKLKIASQKATQGKLINLIEREQKRKQKAHETQELVESMQNAM